MPPETNVHVEIYFDRDSEPVAGRLTAGIEDFGREFSGWMELVAALDCVRGGRRTSPEETLDEGIGDRR